MTQSGQQNTGIFERAMLDNGVVDFSTAPDYLKFEVCNLSIERIHTILLNELEWELPKDTLQDFAKGLLHISTGLYGLHIGPSGTKYPFKELREPVDGARIELGAALKIFDKEDKADDCYQHIRNCRDKLEEAIAFIAGFPSLSP